MSAGLQQRARTRRTRNGLKMFFLHRQKPQQEDDNEPQRRDLAFPAI